MKSFKFGKLEGREYKEYPEKRCRLCPQLFTPKSKNNVYCGDHPQSEIVEYNSKKRGTWHNPEEKLCVGCNKKFETRGKNNIYCSVKCGQKDRFHKAPTSKQWDSLIEYCLERDNYRCVVCKADKKLVIHHIRPLSKFGTNDTSNLETLCEKCHGMKHKIPIT